MIHFYVSIFICNQNLISILSQSYNWSKKFKKTKDSNPPALEASVLPVGRRGIHFSNDWVTHFIFNLDFKHYLRSVLWPIWIQNFVQSIRKKLFFKYLMSYNFISKLHINWKRLIVRIKTFIFMKTYYKHSE